MSIIKFESPPSQCRDLVMWSLTRSIVEDVEDGDEIRELEREIEELTSAVKFGKDRVIQMDEELNAKYLDIANELIRLKEELNSILDAQALQEIEEHLIRSKVHGRQEQEHRQEQPEEFEEKDVGRSVTGPSAKCKKLFRKIANRTHPDKTKDKRMHGIFLAAKQALQMNDYALLQSLFESTKSKVSTLMDSLILRLAELRKHAAYCREILQEMYRNDHYKMSLDYFSGSKFHVENHYAKLIDYQIQCMKAAIRNLDPSRYPLKPVQPTTKFSFNISGFINMLADTSQDVPPNAKDIDNSEHDVTGTEEDPLKDTNA